MRDSAFPQGGHYTAFIKMTERRNGVAALDFSRFYSSPASKSEEVHSLLAEIERKCREIASAKSEENPGKVDENPGEVGEESVTAEEKPEPLAEKWFHISDTHVSEVSVERVLKCQAYLLFYERTL